MPTHGSAGHCRVNEDTPWCETQPLPRDISRDHIRRAARFINKARAVRTALHLHTGKDKETQEQTQRKHGGMTKKKIEGTARGIKEKKERGRERERGATIVGKRGKRGSCWSSWKPRTTYIGALSPSLPRPSLSLPSFTPFIPFVSLLFFLFLRSRHASLDHNFFFCFLLRCRSLRDQVSPVLSSLFHCVSPFPLDSPTSFFLYSFFPPAVLSGSGGGGGVGYRQEGRAPPRSFFSYLDISARMALMDAPQHARGAR